MKTSRTKKARKTLGFYVNNYKFHQPFQVLIDGTFAFAALQVSYTHTLFPFYYQISQYLFYPLYYVRTFQNKFNIQEQLAKYFQSEIKLLTTVCIISETEKLGIFSPAVNGATQIVKQYAIHRCGHEKKPISGSKCFRSMIGKDNSARYVLLEGYRYPRERKKSIFQFFKIISIFPQNFKSNEMKKMILCEASLCIYFVCLL